MKKREVLDIVIIVFGLYLLMGFVTSLATLAYSVFMEENEFVRKGPQVLLTLVHSGILLLLTWLFLFKRSVLLALLAPQQDDPTQIPSEGVPCYARLAFWTQIIGLYFFISSGSKAVGQLAIVVSTRTQYVSNHIWWHQTGHHLVATIVAFLFIWKSEAISTFIRKIAGNGTQA